MNMNEKREQSRVGRFEAPCASRSGRRRLRGLCTRAFSPGFNMAGLRPCRTGVDVASGEVVRVGKRRGPSGRAPGGTRGEVGETFLRSEAMEGGDGRVTENRTGF